MSKQSPISAKAAFGVFAITMCCFTAGATSPALNTLYQQFSSSPQWLVSLVNSIQSLSCLVGILLFGALSGRVKNKTIACWGLLIAAIFGIMPAFSFANQSIGVILVCRLLHGLGNGLYFSIGAAWFSRMIRQESKRTVYLNWNQAVGSLGSTLMTLLGGWFCAVQWNFTFYAYLFILLGWVIMMVCFSEPKSIDELMKEDPNYSEEATAAAKRVSLPPYVWIVICCVLLGQICLSQAMMTMSTLMDIYGAGGAGLVGTLMSIFPLATTALCLVGGPIQNALRQYATPIILLLGCAAMLCIHFAHASVALYTIGMILLGFAAGSLGFTMFDLSLNTTPAGVAWAASLLMFGSNLGNVLSSFVFGGLAAISAAPGFPTLAGAIGYVIVFAVYLLMNLTCKGWKQYKARLDAGEEKAA